MAKLCSHCGKPLWGDGARFCSRCGGSIQPRAQSSKRARAPITRAIPRIEASDQGETLLLESKEELSASQEVQQSALLDADDDTPTQQFAAISPLPGHNVSGSDNCQDSPALRQARVARKEKVVRKKRAIPVSEDPNVVPVSENAGIISVIDGPGNIPVSEDPSIIPISEDPSNIPVSEDPSTIHIFEDLDNIPLSEDPDLISVSENRPDQFTQSSQEEVEPQDLTVDSQLSVPTDQDHISTFDGASVQEMRQSGPLSPSSGPFNRRRSRLRIWLAILLMALVIIGGVNWLLFLQLAPNTSPWQNFSDTKLGFSVRYPTDWQVQIDAKQSIVRFHDSTQTGRVDIAVSSSAIASNVAQFLQQQASQFGMMNLTTGPSNSFAGTSWQQVQGKLSQEGVSYSVTMLATMHGNRFFLLTQIAPKSTYNDEETLIFSVMRAGFRFLP